jgi:cobalamin-dependent methionine synthase I
VCFAHFPVRHDGEYIDLGFAKTNSANLRKNLEGCKSAVLFAATIGLGIDRLIARYSKISPAKALIFQSIGAERIEALCEAFVCDIHNECKKNGSALRPRFSPGYGDLPLDVQKNIFDALDCPRKIGLSLNESLLMSPTKSVTAIIGIKE